MKAGTGRVWWPLCSMEMNPPSDRVKPRAKALCHRLHILVSPSKCHVFFTNPAAPHHTVRVWMKLDPVRYIERRRHGLDDSLSVSNY